MDAVKKSLLRCLDSMAVSLADYGHQWSPEQRQAYEEAISYLTSDDCTETGSSV